MMEISLGAGVAARARRASTSLHASDPNTPSDPTFRNARLSTITFSLAMQRSMVVDEFLGIDQRPQDVLEHLCAAVGWRRGNPLRYGGPVPRPPLAGPR